MLEPEGYFTSLSPTASEWVPLFIGLYRHIADPASHRDEIAPLHHRGPELPRKTTRLTAFFTRTKPVFIASGKHQSTI
eukprot:9284260-Ditylum_brightwellii.AAC.1